MITNVHGKAIGNSRQEPRRHQDDRNGTAKGGRSAHVGGIFTTSNVFATYRTLQLLIICFPVICFHTPMYIDRGGGPD